MKHWIIFLLFIFSIQVNAQAVRTIKADIILPNTPGGNVDIGSDFTINNTSAIGSILNEADMVSNSASALATQESIKFYIDNVAVSTASSLANMGDVEITTVTASDILQWDGDNWVNETYPNFIGMSVGGVLDNASIFDVFSTSQGSRPCPSMTQADKLSIVGPLNGLCVYDTTNTQLSIYDGVTWASVGGGGGGSFNVIEPAHGRAIGKSYIPIYLNAGVWTDAQADVSDTIATHVISNVIDGNTFTVAQTGKYTYTAHGLALGHWFTSETVAGTLTQAEPTISNPIIFVEDANTYHVLNFRASVSTGAISDSHPTYTPIGTTQTIDFNLGRSATVDLGSATGNVAVTLSNPKVGDKQWLKFIQGATTRQISWPSNVLWPGGAMPANTPTNDAIDLVSLAYDGIYYLAKLTKNLVSFLTNTFSIIFDGVDETVVVSDHADFDFERTDSFSLSAWVKTSSATTQYVMSKQDNTANQRGYRLLALSSGELALILGNIHPVGRIFVYATGSNIIDGIWHYVTITYDGTSLASGVNLYIDNVVQAKTVTNDALAGTIQTLVAFRIAGRESGSASWNGNIDEVSVWDKELTAGEVTSMHNAGVPTNLNQHSASASLVSWWRMGDGDIYPTLVDYANAHNGTMINMEAGDIHTDVP